MSRNGSGVQTSPGSSFPVVASTLIESTKFNNVINDINTVLTQSISNDGQTPILANLPMGGFKLTGLAAGTNAGDSVEYNQLLTFTFIPAGLILPFGGTLAPTGFLLCPTAAGGAQLVNRVTYAALFTAIGTAWGVGDGSTTFGIPWFIAGGVPVQGGTVGLQTAGALMAHTHGLGPNQGVAPGGGANVVSSSGGGLATGSTGGGGANNLAAGSFVSFIVKT